MMQVRAGEGEGEGEEGKRVEEGRTKAKVKVCCGRVLPWCCPTPAS